MLTPTQIRPFLMHADLHVRNAVLEYFAGSDCRDETLIPDILRLCETYGAEANVHAFAVCRYFPVSEEALPMLLEHLGRATNKNICYHLNAAIARAPVALLDQHDAAIRDNRHIDEEARALIERRREVADWPGERLWNELESYARLQSSGDCPVESPYGQALVEALGRCDFPDAGTISRLLRKIQKHGEEWEEVFLIQIAGERRLRELTPVLVDMLRVDDDWVLEESLHALGKTGDPEAVRIIREVFASEEWSFKNYAAGVLRAIRLPVSEEAILALLEHEDDVEIRTMLCYSLCELFSERGVEIVRQQIRDGYDEMTASLEEMLLPVIDVLGIELAEADEWRKAREERAAKLAEIGDWDLNDIDDLDGSDEMESWDEPGWVDEPRISSPAPYRKADPKVGRNDPCPCGSGKKYKKCCLGK